MASTNKTTHYDLSQYTASDKPTYLVDYNTDMANIDQGIYDADSLARENESAIGNISNLTTTDKSSLVGAVNELKGKTDSIGNLSNLTTSANTDLVVAINEVDAEADANNQNIGTMTNLETTVKTSLVGAINEVNGKSGNLSNLTTTDKSSLVSAINEVKAEIPDVYSTQEIKSEKVWVDGKPIYHKVITFSSLINNNYNEIGQISNIDHAIHLEGVVSESGDKLPIPYVDYRDLEWSIGLSINIDPDTNLGKVIVRKGGFGTITGDCHVIVEYTKTTD